MDGADYLTRILTHQTLDPNGQELKNLDEKRKKVEELLRREFPDSDPTMSAGGSQAKKTMIRDSYDLDLAIRFDHDDDAPGETLQDIYNNVANALAKEFVVERKCSALRLREHVENGDDEELHIDVVPSRFVDDSEADSYLHQEGTEKERLKTNLDNHIDHVRESGRQDAIRVQRLWRVQKGLRIKTFVLELLVIDELTGQKDTPIDEQTLQVWRHLRDDWETLSAKDPANPEGNDLSPLLSEAVRMELRDAATQAIEQVERDGWESVFGPLPADDEPEERARRIDRLVARAAPTATRPWSNS